MKKVIVSALPLLLMLPFGTDAQCNYNNTIYLSGAAPTVVGSTISGPQTWAGEFNRITGMQAGYTYEVSTCGTPTFDSELTIFQSGGGNWLAYDDDGCGIIGGSSKILFTPAVTGDYDIQLNEFGCLTNSIDMTMDITLISTGTSTGGPSITIPVVVHVVYKNAAENVSNAQISVTARCVECGFQKIECGFRSGPRIFPGCRCGYEY